MKVKTIMPNYGKTVNANGKDYKFDVTGVCEVSDKEGIALIEKYPNLFSDESKPKQEEKKLTLVQELTAEYVDGLDKQITHLKENVKNKEDQIKLLEEDLGTWKDKFNELNQSIEGKFKVGDQTIQSLTKEKAMLEFKCSLLVSSVKELKELCGESKYEKSEWDQKGKEELINYILIKEGY